MTARAFSSTTAEPVLRFMGGIGSRTDNVMSMKRSEERRLPAGRANAAF